MAEESGAGNAGQPSQDNKPEKKPSGNEQKYNNRKRNGKSKPSIGPSGKSTTFKGAVAGLNGRVFKLGSETSKNNQFSRTLEEISNYMARKYAFGGDIARLVRDCEEVDLKKLKPVHPGTDADLTDLRIWEKQVDEYVKRLNAYETNKEALYSIIWGQCSDSMQPRLKTVENYETISEKRLCLELLAEIKGITYKFETQRYPYEALFDVLISFYQNRQHKHQSNTEYHSHILVAPTRIVALLK